MHAVTACTGQGSLLQSWFLKSLSLLSCRYRQQIVCEGVDYRSSTFDPFLDLSLEITKANNLNRALQHFTAEEVLDGDNRYRCPKNNKLVSWVLLLSLAAWWEWCCPALGCSQEETAGRRCR